MCDVCQAVPGALPGDVAMAGHSRIGLKLAVLGANVASPGQVQVILRNHEEEEEDVAMDLGLGTLTVSVTQFG